MDDYIKAYLYDMLTAINEIDHFFIDKPKTFEYYQHGIILKRAIERNMTIIGEAMNRILKIDDTVQLSSSRKIVDLRNRVVHGYDSVTDETIWGIVIKHLPILIRN